MVRTAYAGMMVEDVVGRSNIMMRKCVAVAFAALVAAVTLANFAAEAARCPPGTHWDEWAKICRPVR